MKVVISIPAFNEERTIDRVIKDIKEVMKSERYKFKILVVNDGSKDRTEKVAKENGAIVINNKRNIGLAETFKVEMAECVKLKPDVIVHIDADGQYPTKAIPAMIKKVQAGYDLVLGSRFGKGKYAGSFTKKLGNLAFAKVFSGFLKTKISDTTTGFRAFTQEVAMLPLINTFTYTQEQIIRAGKAHMKITEIPIATKKTRKSRLFGNPLTYAIKAWINILRIYRDFAPLKFFGILGILFILVGAGIGVWIIYRILVFGTTGGIPRVILSMLLILIGVQIGLFGFLADMRKLKND